MATLKDLLEERARTVEKMRALADSPEGANGDLSDDQAKKFDELKAANESLEERIARQQALDDAERRMAGTHIAGTGDRKFDEARREYSLTRAMAGAAGLSVDDGREREVQQEIRNRTGRSFQGIPVPVEVFDERVERRDVLTSSNAGELIATDHLGAQFIDRLREAVVVRRLGARVLRGLSGNVNIPKLTGSATTGWVAENSALTASTHNFGDVELQPKHAGALTELSRNMLQQSSPDIEQLVRADFAQILAAALDRVAIKGGDANEPTGVLETTGVESVDMSGGVTWANVQEVIGKVEDEDSEGTAFITRANVVRVLRTTNRVSEEPEHGFIMEARDRLDGFPVARTNLVPVTEGDPDTSELIFGRWSDLLIGFWSELDVLVNPFAKEAYEKGNVMVRAMMTADVALRHPESFAHGTGIDIT